MTFRSIDNELTTTSSHPDTLYLSKDPYANAVCGIHRREM